MGNSVTRARARRNLGLAEALEAALVAQGIGPGRPYAIDVVATASYVRAELAARGLEVADIGGQRADDDGAHRVVP